MGSKRSLELWLLVFAIATAATTSLPMALPNCTDSCGNVSIPYPFGIGTKCSLSDDFSITCNSTSNPPKPFIPISNTEIVNISLDTGEVYIYKSIAYNCFNQSDMVNASAEAEIKLSNRSVYRFSDTHNKFTAIGCYTLAYINRQEVDEFATGCASFCDSPDSGTDGSCDGIGCCQTSIPKNLTYYNVSWGFTHNPLRETVPCSYAMLVDKNYSFSTSDLPGYQDFLKKNDFRVQLVLDWAVRNLTCPEAKASTDYACRSSNSECYNSTNDLGYLCKCSQGYEGNPYLDSGCKDIDECLDPDKYLCQGDCNNTPGDYDCKCPGGTRRGATKGVCSKIRDKFPFAAKVAVGISSGLTLVLALCFLLVIKSQKRKYLRERDEYFKQNGGLILYEQMRSEQVDTVRVFTEEELKKATNNFDDERIIGRGGHGMVYKGILQNKIDVGKV